VRRAAISAAATQFPTYDPSIGYTGTTPFSDTFTDCSAKEKRLLNPNGSPDDPNNVDYVYLPLIDVQDVINDINNFTREPRPSRESSCLASSAGPRTRTTRTSRPTFKPTPTTGLTRMPPRFRHRRRICGLHAHCTIPSQKSTDGNIYKAYGGLRLKKFIDAFGNRGKRSASVILTSRMP